jgi:precorrin-3B methylase
VSLGPGARPYLIPAALRAITSAEVLVGYKTYLELIADLRQGKKVLASGMRKEVERCQAAIDAALAGERVALVSSGDAGIYGMAGLVFDICRSRKLRVCAATAGPGPLAGGSHPGVGGPSKADLVVEVIPGVAAFNAAASILGAPLMHDFAAISLSDHLTPWELIEKRLEAVALGDFVVAIYNPRSKSRPDLLEQAQKVLLRHRSPATPVGIVRHAMREGEWRKLAALGDIPFEEVDMQTLLIIGNSQTYLWDGWMVTPRGYLAKYAGVVDTAD